MVSQVSSNPERVLLVEDDPAITDVVRRALAVDGHDVECCNNATQALERINNDEFPVVITDLRLPDGLGTEILRRSIQMHPHAAVIVVTGDSHYATAAEAIRDGAYGYIPKPFASENIRLMVRQAVERCRLMRERDRFEWLSMTDPLTSLDNRRKLDQVLDREVGRASRFDHPLSLLAVDIDGIKECNDRLGRAAGDEIIRAVAGILVGATRQVDHVARYGGDEFAVVLPETPASGATVAARRYCQATSGTEGAPAKLSVSIGRATYPDDAKTAKDLLAEADSRMYRAKRAGGNGWYPE